MRGIEDTSVLGVGLQSGVGQLGIGYLGVRGEGLNTDGLSLDLQFAADKTLTARKGPTPVFTRASTATFVGSDGLIQSAAINAARFDHDPVSPFACKGLLIEESRTNLILRSQSIVAPWTLLGATITQDSEVAPDGTTTADTSNVTTSGANFVTQTVTVTPSTSYVFSFYVKRGTATEAAYSIVNSTAGGNIVAPTSYFSQTSSTSWNRISVSFTTPVGCVAVIVYLTRNIASLGTTHFWGAQLEAGSFATSYIPTVASTVVRSADTCSITGSDFTTVYNESEHTLFAEASGMSHAGFPSYLSFDNSTSAEQSTLAGYPSSNRAVCAEVDGGTTFASVQIAITLNQNNKMAAAMKLNSFQLAVNNVLGTEDTSGTMATANSLKIGRNWSSAVLSGTFKQVKVFRKRLPDAKLQSLTT